MKRSTDRSDGPPLDRIVDVKHDALDHRNSLNHQVTRVRIRVCWDSISRFNRTHRFSNSARCWTWPNLLDPSMWLPSRECWSHHLPTCTTQKKSHTPRETQQTCWKNWPMTRINQCYAHQEKASEKWRRHIKWCRIVRLNVLIVTHQTRREKHDDTFNVTRTVQMDTEKRKKKHQTMTRSVGSSLRGQCQQKHTHIMITWRYDLQTLGWQQTLDERVWCQQRCNPSHDALDYRVTPNHHATLVWNWPCWDWLSLFNRVRCLSNPTWCWSVTQLASSFALTASTFLSSQSRLLQSYTTPTKWHILSTTETINQHTSDSNLSLSTTPKTTINQMLNENSTLPNCANEKSNRDAP